MSRKKRHPPTTTTPQESETHAPKARLIVGILLLLAAALRLWDLEIKPPHFDEGINGWFAHQMKQSGYYQYNHENFHGPLYFYLVYMFQAFLGSELFAIRLPAVIGSMLIVWGLLLYQPIFGRSVALLAALCAAVSPGQIFYGRYSIHESWFAAALVFTLLGFLGMWKYGSRQYLWILVLGLVTAVCLKETYIIHFGCMLIAFACCWWYTVKWRKEELGWAPQTWSWRDFRHATLVGGFIFLALYSGLFMNWSGVGSFFQGLTSWISTGVSQKSGHEKAWHYWFWLLAWYEQATLLGLIFVTRYLWKCDVRMRYLAIYALGTFLVYSIIAYKTPWCMISFQWPFFIIVAHIVTSAVQMFPAARRAVVPIMLGPLFIALPLNWINHSNPQESYAYVTTSTRIWDGIRPLLDLPKQDARYTQLKGFVALESYYPVPWILHQFTDVGYGPHPLPAGLDFAIVEAAKTGELAPEYQNYEKTIFQIRDGQAESALLVRPEIVPAHK